MAHYAFLNDSNVVVEVIVGKDEGEGGIDWEQYYGELRGQVCKRTSYNTYGNKHLHGGTPLRKNYAGIGYRYDSNLDAFIPPQPYASWVLNEETCLWEAPIPTPQDGKRYTWDEASLVWVPLWEPPIPMPSEGGPWFWSDVTQNWEIYVETDYSDITTVEVFK